MLMANNKGSIIIVKSILQILNAN